MFEFAALSRGRTTEQPNAAQNLQLLCVALAV